MEAKQLNGFNPMDESSDEEEFMSDSSSGNSPLESDSSEDDGSDSDESSVASANELTSKSKKRKKSTSSAKVSSKRAKVKKGKTSTSKTKPKKKKKKKTNSTPKKKSSTTKEKKSAKDLETSEDDSADDMSIDSSSGSSSDSDSDSLDSNSDATAPGSKASKKTKAEKSKSGAKKSKSGDSGSKKKKKTPSKTTESSAKSDDGKSGSKRKVLDEILDERIALTAARAGVPFTPGSANEEENQNAINENNSEDPGIPRTTDDVDNLKADERGQLERNLQEKYALACTKVDKRKRRKSTDSQDDTSSQPAETDTPTKEEEEDVAEVSNAPKEVDETQVDNEVFSTNEDGIWMRRLDRVALYLKDTGEMVDMEYLDSDRSKGECVAFGTLLAVSEPDGGETPTGAKIYKERTPESTIKTVRIQINVQDWALDYTVGDHSLWLVSETAWYKIGGPLTGLRPAPYYVPKFRNTRKLFEACSQVVNVLTELVAAAGKYILSAKIVYDQIWFRSFKGRFDFAPSGSWWSARNQIRARFIDRNGLFIFEQICSLDSDETSKVFQQARFSQAIRAKAEQFKAKDKKVAENKLKRDLEQQQKRDKALEQKRARSEAIRKEKEKRGERLRAKHNARKRFYAFLEENKKKANYRKDVESKIPVEDLALYAGALRNEAFFKTGQHADTLQMLQTLDALSAPKTVGVFPAAWQNTSLYGGGSHLKDYHDILQQELENQDVDKAAVVKEEKENESKGQNVGNDSQQGVTNGSAQERPNISKLPALAKSGSLLLALDDAREQGVDESKSTDAITKGKLEGIMAELWSNASRFSTLLKLDKNISFEHFKASLEDSQGTHLTIGSLMVRIARTLLSEERDQNLKVLGLEDVTLTLRDQVEDQLRTDANVFDLPFKRNVTRAEKNRCLRTAFEDQLHLRVLGPSTWQEPLRELLANQTEECPDLQWLVGSNGDSIEQCDRVMTQLRLFAPEELNLFQNPMNLMQQLLQGDEGTVPLPLMLSYLRILEDEEPDSPDDEVNSCYRFGAINSCLIEERLAEDWYNPVRASSKPVLKAEQRQAAKHIAQLRRKGAQEEHDPTDRRVPVWNYESSVRVGGLAAPVESQLDSFLQKYPEFEVYQGQDMGDAKDPAEAEKVDQLLGKGGGVMAFVRDIKALYVPFLRQVVGKRTIVPPAIHAAACRLESVLAILCGQLLSGEDADSLMHVKWTRADDVKYDPCFEELPSPVQAPLSRGDEMLLPVAVDKQVVDHVISCARTHAEKSGLLPVPQVVHGRAVKGREEAPVRNDEVPSIVSIAALRDLIVDLGVKDFGELSMARKLLFLKLTMDRFLSSEVVRTTLLEDFDSWYEQRRVQREIRHAERRERVKSVARACGRTLAHLEDLRKHTVQKLEDKSQDFAAMQFTYQERGDSETDIDTDAEAEISEQVEKLTDELLESGKLKMVKVEKPVSSSATNNGTKSKVADDKTKPTETKDDPEGKAKLKKEESKNAQKEGAKSTEETKPDTTVELQRPTLPAAELATIRKRVVAARQKTIAEEQKERALSNFGTYEQCLSCGMMIRPIGRDRFFRRYILVVQGGKIAKLFLEDGAHNTGALYEFQTMEEVEGLIDSLDPRGTRESQLLMNLKHMQPKLAEYFKSSKSKATKKGAKGCQECATCSLYSSQIKKAPTSRIPYVVQKGCISMNETYALSLRELHKKLESKGALRTVSWEQVSETWDRQVKEIAAGKGTQETNIRCFAQLESEVHQMFNFHGSALRRDWDMSRVNRLADTRITCSSSEMIHRLAVFKLHDIDWEFIEKFCRRLEKSQWIDAVKSFGVDGSWTLNKGEEFVYFPEGHIEFTQTLYDNMIEEKQIMEHDFSHKAWLTRYDTNERKIKSRGITPFLCKVVDVEFFKGTESPFCRVRLSDAKMVQEKVKVKGNNVPESDHQDMRKFDQGEGSWEKLTLSNDGMKGALAMTLAEMMRMTKSWLCSKHFLAPVDLEAFPDYTDAVDTPMDLSLISRRVAQRWYSSVGEFLKDIVLIYDNSKKYCTRKYPKIVRAAYEMQSRATRECEKLESAIAAGTVVLKATEDEVHVSPHAEVGEFQIDIPCTSMTQERLQFLVPLQTYEEVLENSWATKLGADFLLEGDIAGEFVGATVMGCRPNVQLGAPLPWRPICALHHDPDLRVLTEAAECHPVNPWEMKKFE